MGFKPGFAIRLGITALVAAGASSLSTLAGGGQDLATANPKQAAAYTPIVGSFGTDELTRRAADGAAEGWGPRRINRKVYAPFIIAGPSTFTDTWGAPRSGPAPGQVRTHQGQDVFCNYGDPVLAAEAGTIEFSGGGLGGLVTRLHRADGSYWYYAHLADWNDVEFSSGDTVSVGDVIGYCGNSGNAASTPSHVHFGWYLASGEAMNPMETLIGWLAAAEGRSYEPPRRAAGSKGKPGRGDAEVEAQRMHDGSQATLSLAIQPADQATANKPNNATVRNRAKKSR